METRALNLCADLASRSDLWTPAAKHDAEIRHNH